MTVDLLELLARAEREVLATPNLRPVQSSKPKPVAKPPAAPVLHVVAEPEPEPWPEPEPVDPSARWQDGALWAQVDGEAFFPEKGGSTREAKRVCLSCDVRVECLEYALDNDIRHGIWGGLSERERRRAKKRAV